MVESAKRTILVIEDNDLNREILCEILSPYYNVIQAENGKVGLELLSENRLSVSLVLLDIQMPVMNGYEFLDAIRSKPYFSNIPIIVTTSSSNAMDEIKCLEDGASDFVSKPYKVDVVLRRVASMIRLSEASAVINRIEYDALTGLYSKDFFYLNADRMISANPDVDYDMVCGDIKSFKMINDRYGTKLCNDLLVGISDLLRKIVPSNGIYGRISGDIFAIMLPSCDVSVYYNAVEKVNEYIKSSQIPTAIMQWGVCLHIDKSLSSSVNCDKALLAIESIKFQHKGILSEYDENLRQKLVREQIMLDSVDKALKSDDQLFIYYQPKYHLEKNRVLGAEALIRWIHPELGFMNPGEFIPLFEKNGLISSLDNYVVEKVCSDMSGWLKEGIEVVPISLNVSRADFENPDLAENITYIADKYGIPHELLHLEVTESIYSDYVDQILSATNRLHDAGFMIELDDFGSGYSSLNILNDMCVDVLKIDMSLVRNILTSDRQKLILKNIINIAIGLGTETVAEGVELTEQADILRELGCTFAQGYLYSKPIPKENFEKFLK